MLDWLKTILGDAYTDDIDKKVSDEIGKNFVARADFNTLNTEKKSLAETVKERDKQLDDLKKATGDADALKKQIDELQAANREQKKAHDAEMRQIRMDSAVELALSAAKAKNVKAVKALLDMEKVDLTDEGAVKGLDEQIKKLMAAPDSGFLFETAQQNGQGLSGLKPGERSDGGSGGMTLEKFRAMSPSDRHDFSVKHPEEYKALYGGTN